jgi:rhodanese-related sulfurtransferase
MPSAGGKKILVYCAMGGRSQNAVIQCWHAGIEAINVAGGIVAWHRAGLPLEAG